MAAKTIATPHHERHRSENIGWLRAAVLGANDGLISTSSLVVGVAAASGVEHAAVLLTASAGLVAGALSMAAGEYVSVSSQADTERADYERERRELADNPAFELYGETITAVDGVVRNAAGALAGSALDMITAVRNTVGLLGLSLAEASRMASTYPAQFLGLDDRYGQIAAGYQADFVLLDTDLQVQATWIAGQRD